ncbi:transposase [Proteiniphilum saccharofermentans]|uniref:Mutator family transposase n=1 Tax=Proteiniphilum saccharofermentans TaxID=1642647 RepID=A0A1R3TE42_9BACT|nr:transposase [Proteiniphilum saccharofermentans]
MRKEELLNDDFFKQFKSGKEFESFLSGLHKRGIEQMLEGELDHHLGYDKHAKSGHSNARNGYGSKTIKTGFGEARIDVPRDRDSSFEPVIVPKRKSLAEGIESLVISLYAKGMSNADIEEQLHEIYDFRLSTSAISRITDRVTEDIIAWQKPAPGRGLHDRLDGRDRFQGARELQGGQQDRLHCRGAPS